MSINRRNASHPQDGFTLMEVLVVIAIIAVLVAVAIPIFGNQVDNAKRATDQANIKGAEEAAVAQYYTDGMPDIASYYFDAASGTVKSSVAGIQGYGQSPVEVEGASGVPNPGGNSPKVVNIMFTDGGSSRVISWGGSAARNIVTEAQIATATEAQRVAQDTTLLNALQDAVQGMTAGQLKQLLGDADLNHKDFIIGITKARAKGQQSKIDGYAIEGQSITPGFEELFASVGVDVDKVKSMEEYLLTTAGSGNDVRIKIYVGENKDLQWWDDDKVLSKAYIYLDAQDDQDKKFSSLYTTERAKTVS